jgi:exonuclease III
MEKVDMRVATWNLKQAVAPRKSVPELLDWADAEIQADVYVFTEAKVTPGVDSRLRYQWSPEGVYPDKANKWGTVLATRSADIREVTQVRTRLKSRKLEFEWPAAVQICDVLQNGERWATLVGLYAVTRDQRGENIGSGTYSFPRLMSQLEALLGSDRGDRLILAGDFNLWPGHVSGELKKHGLVDLIEATSSTRPPLENCQDCEYFAGTKRQSLKCGHLFTHRNGMKPKPGKKFGGMIQQIDYVAASPDMVRRVERVFGGEAAFPGIWELSDHAPVVVDFKD